MGQERSLSLFIPVDAAVRQVTEINIQVLTSLFTLSGSEGTTLLNIFLIYKLSLQTEAQRMYIKAALIITSQCDGKSTKHYELKALLSKEDL